MKLKTTATALIVALLVVVVQPVSDARAAAKHIGMSPASYITGGKLVLGQDLSQARF
jgi:hypothetical protein